ncbi:beta-ketoacyl synthase chain length factor [Aquitalea aquatica]|uniref:Beta-ketoacyl synthase chain length factor n=1 Tax=Aquitalea aquatica TaxID=3044273 RepID=A0A838Y5L0_9NEIS|nr:beta-ketoacyl synthase chain length factor [Aquitalea magnusonii]MBA4707837.1 beta-ketoacyl synthase chain length factor [Aquitalea magnusonii]
MSTVTVYLQGLSVLGPGMPDWSAAQPCLLGQQAHVAAAVVLPPAQALPATERRRVGAAVKLSMAVGLAAVADAAADAAQLPNIFSSTGGDCENCHSLLDVLASDERLISPTRFHNSVHNAPAGYWGIATGCTAASTSLCAYDATFAAGLLECATQALSGAQSCLLVSFDTAYPEPLYAQRPIPYPMGVGMVLSPQASAASKARLQLALTQEPATTMQDVGLEQLRLSIPSARSLPLLQLLASGQPGRVVIDYLDDCRLAIEVAA